MGAVLFSALALSLVTLRPSEGRTDAIPGEQGANPSSASVDQVMFAGQVVDPEGQPRAGARIYLGWYWETRDEKPAVLRATSGPDGRFQFQVDKALFRRPGNPEIEPWNDARLLAVSPPFGLGLSDSKEPDANRAVTLRLVRDDVPITGRVIDLEGRPVPDARPARLVGQVLTRRGPGLLAPRDPEEQRGRLRSGPEGTARPGLPQ